jgi:hypothetical protein
MGTEIYLLTPNGCMLLATPANSESTSQKLHTTSAAITKNVMRNPYSSRISSLRPLPVTTPMRAAISWAKVRATATGIMVQSSECPNWAPAEA